MLAIDDLAVGRRANIAGHEGHPKFRFVEASVVDRDRMAVIHQLEQEATGRRDVRWLIEELRIAQLAPGPFVRPGATVKRVREALTVG